MTTSNIRGLLLLMIAQTALAGSNADDSFTSIPFFAPQKKASQMDRFKSAFAAITNDKEVSNVLKNSDHGLSFDQMIGGTEVETTKFQAHYQGIEVLGSMVLHHKGNTDGIDEITNDLAQFDINATPTVSKDDAVGIAKSLAGDSELFLTPELKILPNKSNRTAQLIYIVKLKAEMGKEAEGGKDLWIDAQSGEIVAQIPHQQEIAPIDILAANSNCQQIDDSGAPISYNPAACTPVYRNTALIAGTTADESANNAFSNSKLVVGFYMSKFGRNGFDNLGSRVTSIVHIGNGFNNAFWDTQQNIMGYGDGDGTEFKNFTSGVDVAAHEMTHGVTSQTAKLLNIDQSGALNEAFSDFFGVMIANGGQHWEIGKDLMIDPTARGIRDLANPNSMHVIKAKRNPDGSLVLDAQGNPIKEDRGPYPDKMSQIFPKPSVCDRKLNDNCWVHINSTIQGHASYLVAQSIGADAAMKLYFTALTQYLTPMDSLTTVKGKVLKACKKVLDTKTCAKVTAAYKQVGL